MKRIASFFLALVLLAGTVPFLPVGAATTASSPWPKLSSSGYALYVCPGNTSQVYQNAEMTIRGTLSPKKAYNSSISAGDELWIIGFTEDGAGTIVKYPTVLGRRTAIVPTKTLLGVSAPVDSFIAQASVPAYKLVGSTASRWGSTAVGDRMLLCGRTKDGTYALCFYQAVSGNRQWKVGFFRLSDLALVRGSGSSQNLSNQTMSDALYQRSGGRISCGFDGYSSREKGRHEGIDFVMGYGSAVYSLTDGVITRVSQGYNGSKGLSTIAIYSEETNKTVVYLHTDPLDSLYAGQRITRGQQIATEAWRGCSSSSGTHTHVEVRNGRVSYATYSVKDPILLNQDPTAFWNAQGYVVK